MTIRIALIGFGEAGTAFATGMAADVTAFDVKMQGGGGDALMTAARRSGVAPAATNAAAVAQADAVISVVTADQARAAAEESAATIRRGALFLDMNSVSPETKRANAVSIEDAGGAYVDVAVMSPVDPRGRAVPLLVAGPHASAARELLSSIGFTDVRAVTGDIGAASAIKMIRSVMVKGLEALSAECAIAGQAAGVLDEVLASLDASWPGADWARRIDYNLDRMMVHGLRRAEEMREAAATLAGLGVEPAMTRGTIARQQALGALRAVPPDRLDAKLAMLAPFTTEQQAG